MRCRDVSLILAAGLTLVPGLWAQDSTQQAAQEAAQQAQLRAMIEQIARDRPPQAEMAARDLFRKLQLAQATLDSLRQRSLAEYWAEVAQLTVQRQMLEQQADSARRLLMTQMFGAEARARGLQRAYRDLDDSTQAGAIRARLREVLERHLAAEDSLRDLEVADIERRIAQVRAETARRRRERAELVRRMVEQVLQDARRAP